MSTGDLKISLRKPLASARAVPKPASEQELVSVTTEVKPVGTPDDLEVFITARMVGIFHSIDSVGAVGTAVKAGQVVGAIESMKLLNDAVSDHDGVIAEVLVEDGMPVEYGQRLFRLEPAVLPEA